MAQFASELKAGYLKYYYTEGLPNWHACVAKNTAHLLASGDIVTNLDCDNFTGKKGARMVLNCFQRAKGPITLHQFSGRWSDGSFGRISVYKSIFLAIGGYDESFAPMGFQDADLVLRLWKIGVTYVRIKNKKFNKAIFNTKEEGIKYCNSSEDYDTMNLKNRILSIQRLVTSPDSVRNNKKLGVSADIFDYKGELVPSIPLDIDKNQARMRQYSLRPPDNIPTLQDTFLTLSGILSK